MYNLFALRWRHNDHAGVSNHQPHGCLLNRLFRRNSKKTSKLRVTGLCAGNSPGTGEFPAQMASYAENVSIWWRHHGLSIHSEKSAVRLVSQTIYWHDDTNNLATEITLFRECKTPTVCHCCGINIVSGNALVIVIAKPLEERYWPNVSEYVLTYRILWVNLSRLLPRWWEIYRRLFRDVVNQNIWMRLDSKGISPLSSHLW